MLDNFTEEYKKIMLDAENLVKKNGFVEVVPQDIFFEITKIKAGPIYDILANFGINEKITLEVFTQKQFDYFGKERIGEYFGISKELKNLIISSLKQASSLNKKKVGIDDFLLCSIKERQVRIYNFFDFLGISPKDFETALLNFNKKMGQGGNDALFQPFNDILNALEENINGELENNPFAVNKPQEGKKERQTPAIDFFGTDLTEEAKKGNIDKIIGRDLEIERLISILNRKTKNNPCLVGEPGVGKTAVVEGLARRIAEGNVPFAMQNKRIVSIDLGGLVAGTKYRGEFEQRIKQIIDEASRLENEIILFIDEIHTIIGAGGGEGTLDAANILKPAMGRGKICVIGATTFNEYQKYIEKDSALERRFQKVEVDEPTGEVATEIIKGLKESFEEFHNLVIEDSAIENAVKLSIRYITDRNLPDKAIDILDEACSSKSMKYGGNEEEIKEIKLESEKISKDIESFVISQQYGKAIEAKDKLRKLEDKIKEKKAKVKIPKSKRLHITDTDIQKIINQISGVPLKNLNTENLEKLRNLDKSLGKYIIGQDEAIGTIVSSIKRNMVGISSQKRPIGSFLFLGPTGVGKTELVKVLAKEFFGDEKALIKLDMSEYSERASASKLIGTTAGYVGYEEGGILTEQVRRKPYSIVLFDELEKGTPEVFNMLLQIMEDGNITDGKGRKINFRNTIVIMTSNIGGEEFNSKATQIGFDVGEKEEEKILRDYEQIKEKVLKSLDEYFAPEFINRIDKVVVFNPLDKKELKKIIVLQLEELKERFEKIGIKMEYTAAAISLMLKETYNPEYGARPVRRYIQDKIEEEIADLIISKKVKDKVKIDASRSALKIN
ncbi:MAG: ATP-dependent Clp protease ATP-binding subunit [Candidatus Gracilibacteria bacterium]|nr:ATP-dependent Clp protease ATP-binding subunit [Candidatus Gracilibacteria bacterium]